MNENNLNISIRELKEIKNTIIKSNSNTRFRYKEKDYSCDKRRSIEVIDNLIDIVRRKNGVIYG